MPKFLEIFVDESSQTQNRYLVLGGIACDKSDVPSCERQFGEVRNKYALFGELKWTKVSRSKLTAYKEFADTFFSLMRAEKLAFHCLIADTSTFDHATYNRGSAEVGFNKLVYQLLVKFGRLYGDNYRLYVYLDRRTTKASLIEFQAILNAGLRKYWDIHGWPVRRLHFRDSTSSDLFQMNDLLIGAIAHKKNRHHLQPNASPARREFFQHLTRGARITDICRDTPRAAVNFSIWNFRYYRRK